MKLHLFLLQLALNVRTANNAEATTSLQKPVPQISLTQDLVRKDAFHTDSPGRKTQLAQQQ